MPLADIHTRQGDRFRTQSSVRNAAVPASARYAKGCVTCLAHILDIHIKRSGLSVRRAQRLFNKMRHLPLRSG